MEQPSAAAVSK